MNLLRAAVVVGVITLILTATMQSIKVALIGNGIATLLCAWAVIRLKQRIRKEWG